MQLLAAQMIVLSRRLVRPGWILFDEVVREVGDGHPPERVREAAASVTTLGEGVLTPGLVDIQVNGAFGVDFAAATDDEFVRVAEQMPSTGVTAFVPTFITAPVEDMADCLATYGSLRPRLDAAPGAARTLGIHLEGPFLAERRRGAHRADLLSDPDPALIEDLLTAAGGCLTYMTLAPERAGAIAAIRQLTSAGVRVALGHTDADAPTVRAAADAGATLVTHLYNAQRPMRHRDPGTVGAALTDPRLTCGLIVDLHHVAPIAVEIAFRAAAGAIALVTDAVAAMGMPAGSYQLGGDRLEIAPGLPPRRADGAIAGSALRMDEAIANAVLHCGVDLGAAINAATQIPASAIGRNDLGRLAPGAPADLAWLGDDLIARTTWVGGQRAWSRDHEDASAGARR
ncbi:MAG: N-acetylglucosamine-6-phosphate deacetylase [Geodermatophilaceae bacterium]|nr:N-acetylglucosamine-6-phosphate deacetylase [Geodermatophilaceae bacterium]